MEMTNEINQKLQLLKKYFNLKWIGYNTILLNGIVRIDVYSTNNIFLKEIKNKLYLINELTNEYEIRYSLNRTDINILKFLGYNICLLNRGKIFIIKENNISSNSFKFKIDFLSNPIFNNFIENFNNVMNYSIIEDIYNKENKYIGSYIKIKNDEIQYLVSEEIVYNYREFSDIYLYYKIINEDIRKSGKVLLLRKKINNNNINNNRNNKIKMRN